MAKDRNPVTPAILDLKKNNVPFTLHPYRYEERGGTRVSARKLEVNEHIVIKTLVMEDERGLPLIVLMHGDKHVSTKSLARLRGAKSIIPCDQKTAEKHTGYRVGGTSPFGMKKELQIFMEESIVKLPTIFINAGTRGLLVEIAPADLVRVLKPILVTVAI